MNIISVSNHISSFYEVLFEERRICYVDRDVYACYYSAFAETQIESIGKKYTITSSLNIGSVLFAYRNKSERGLIVLRLKEGVGP